MKKDALLSPCGKYRYTLYRRWGTGPCVNFIGLNPSTADSCMDDPTIRRMMGFAQSWEYGAMIITNLFAMRETRPSLLMNCSEPIGEYNDTHLLVNLHVCPLVIACWGRYGLWQDRQQKFLLMLKGVQILCLGRNKDATPKHPLYLPKTATAISFYAAPG